MGFSNDLHYLCTQEFEIRQIMIIKVCGMREPENIREVTELGVDMIGFDFIPGSKRYVQMVSSNAGILPDYAERGYGKDKENANKVMRVGAFADDMPQNIITRIYNYNLDCVQLDGDESAVMIDNLRRSVDPDIHKGLKIIKTIKVEGVEDLNRWHEFNGHVDMLLFEMCSGDNGKRPDRLLLNEYKGTVPFLLAGVTGIEDIEKLSRIDNPMFAGIDLGDEFETAPALKDIDKIRKLVSWLKEKGLRG